MKHLVGMSGDILWMECRQFLKLITWIYLEIDLLVGERYSQLFF